MRDLVKNPKMFVWLVLVALLIVSIVLMVGVGYTMDNFDIIPLYDDNGKFLHYEVMQNPTKIMLMSFLSGTLGGSIIGVVLKGSGEWIDGKQDDTPST